ncbi:MAG: hypothetical protein ACLR23_29365 [Clostridia bacterium]
MKALYDKRDALLRNLEAESKTLIAKYLAKIPKTTGLEYYKQLYTDDQLFDSVCCGLPQGILLIICGGIHSGAYSRQQNTGTGRFSASDAYCRVRQRAFQK